MKRLSNILVGVFAVGIAGMLCAGSASAQTPQFIQVSPLYFTMPVGSNPLPQTLTIVRLDLLFLMTPVWTSSLRAAPASSPLWNSKASTNSVLAAHSAPTGHNGAELTAAGWSVVQRRGGNITVPANAGFFRIGVRPIADDIGLGGNDDFGLPLFSPAPASAAGTFKAPGLRNVEFTGPYFHNGSQATLEQVLEFYGRNGDFPDGGNLGPGIGNIRLSQTERTAIVAFLKALSDDRVRFQRAPFDHPSMCVPNGHVEQSGQLETDPAQSGSIALDKWALILEVGMEGTSVPLQTFDELLNGIGNDGTRANTMTTGCTP